MFYNNYQRNRLFHKYDLGAVFRAKIEDLKKEIKNIPHEVLSEKKDEELIDDLLPKYSFCVPTLKLDEIKVSPKEAEIQVPDVFASRYRNETVTVNGFRITVTIPFVGEADMFQVQPSTMTLSGTPSPTTITEDSLVFVYETREQDPEKIKALWGDDIGSIQQNLGWINRDVDRHNNSLRDIIQEHIRQRRKDSGNNEALFEQLRN